MSQEPKRAGAANPQGGALLAGKPLDEWRKILYKFATSIPTPVPDIYGIDDLVQDGFIGVLKAINHRSFDSSRGEYSLLSWCASSARWRMLSCVQECASLIRVPTGTKGYIRRAKASGKLDHVRLKEVTIQAALELSSSSAYVSLDAPLAPDDDAGTLYDVLPTEQESPEEPDFRRSVREALYSLQEPHRTVLALRYGVCLKHLSGDCFCDNDPLTLEEIGRSLSPSISKEAVRQKQYAAEKKLLRILEKRGIP